MLPPDPFLLSPPHPALQAADAAVVLLSGGLDSAVSVAWWLHHHPKGKAGISKALTFAYGQRAEAKELSAAQAIAQHYGLSHQIIPLPWLSSLLPSHYGQAGLETVQNWEAPQTETGVERVWVPNRNGILLNIAAGLAEGHKATHVIFGANREEAEAGFPDNTADYRQRVNHALQLSTLTHVQVIAPLESMNKREILQVARQLQVPLELTWSCYEAQDNPCGVCPSCVIRVNADNVLNH